MKFMKIGTRPDTFYTEEATRTVASDIPTDLILRVNNITYLLHKFPLLPKCGLLQQLCSGYDESESITIDLHDIPGGEDAFELCAKYCYGITINLSAHNFLPALCAAKFLRMVESVEKGNFVPKLEAFFNSCILEGWKDSIITLQTTSKLPEWSENLGIARKCIDSIVEKILTPPPKVTWSYTYTRPGYDKKNRHSAPRDWWTEDISDLEIDLFRCIIITIRATNMLPPQLIGEALHVHASRWLPDTTRMKATEGSASQSRELTERNRRILENIVSMVPSDRGSVSVGFLLRLLSIGNFIGVSSATRTELIRRSSQQLDEATVNDLLLPSHSPSSEYLYDIELVSAVLESYWALWRRQPKGKDENSQTLRSIRKVAKVIDLYLQVVSKDANLPVSKVVALAEALPDIARSEHDDLYKAINTYLKEHPDLEKAEKKRLCRVLDCQKLSPEVRAHAVKNERLPLRTVVQVLFFDQEKSSKESNAPQKLSPREILSRGKQSMSIREDQCPQGEGRAKANPPLSSMNNRDHEKMKRLAPEFERKLTVGEIEEVGSTRGKEINAERHTMRRQRYDPSENTDKRSRSDHSSAKGRDGR
ncbi:BTB/POZ domain-containing protein At5g47800 isoform X2 [Punica granatum]|uniref:BTB/POZ domain-containing protein At5g47800 isoform X2 n=1 Tax=Punica granatum TaxID=22663 RepID=A0A218XMF8_PUNGR|nr:BTB/POZ domain-containing protein At5g47800 isoform X2 [Punica granatum]OWM85661.1 hypothetical protein CDL15_Pgr029084 [Punica granatum]